MAHIEKRSANTYRITVSAGYNSQGKKIRKHKTVEFDAKLTPKQTEKELQRLSTLFEEEVSKGTYLDASKLTLKEFSDKWLTDYAEGNLASKTVHCYRDMLDRRIIPSLGHLRLEKIQPHHLIEFYNNLSEPGIGEGKLSTTLSGSTILKYHRILSSILQDAVQWQLLLTNPCSRIKPPKSSKKDIQVFDESKIVLLIEALESQPNKYKVLVLLALVTGLRRGELCALQWNNIDFKNSVIEVKYSIQYIPKVGTTLKEPKTKGSRRKISVPESIMTLLKSLKAELSEERLKLGDLWEGSDWVFVQWDGQVMHVDSITKWFRKFLLSYNEQIMSDETIPKDKKDSFSLPITNFHALRHTSATMLINKGLNVRALSNRLGHANASTTLNIYSHALQSVDKQASDIMENILAPSKKIKQA